MSFSQNRCALLGDMHSGRIEADTRWRKRVERDRSHIEEAVAG